VTQTTHDSSTTSGVPPYAGGNGGGRGRMTFRLSVIALLVSVLSIGLSLLALFTAGRNASSAPAPQETAATAPASDTNPAESRAPSETASDEETSQASNAPLPTASANYTVSYQDRRLSLQPNGRNCLGGRSIDLDQPAINVLSGGDIEYNPTSGCQGPPSLRFASDKLATVSSADATPEDCAQAIQLSPASQDIAPSQDLVICAVTDGQGAANEPVRAKIARIVVAGVGQEQKVTLNVTTWEIPH
jgi:hypothetical protein